MIKLQDKIDFIHRAIPQMASYTFPFVSSVVEVRDSESGALIGSGLRCLFKGRRAVVTAGHVIEEALRASSFAFSAGYGVPPYVFRARMESLRESDLAVCFLPDDYPPASEQVAFWPLERSDISGERLGSDYLFAHGFPGERSRFFRLANGLALKSLPYGAMQRLEDLPGDLKPSQFALDFNPSHMHYSKDESQPSPDPSGLNGSPVWRIGISGKPPAQWSPQESLLVGFLTQWRQDARILVATRVSQLTTIE
jgi:hypothetical protein